MATKTENEIRLELPSTSGVECSIRENLSRDEYILAFFQNERQLKSCSIPQSQLNQDKMVDILSDAGVEFFSFSAIFDVADLLIDSIKKEFQETLIIEEKPAKEVKPEKTQIFDTESKTIAKTEEITESKAVKKKVSIESGDKLLKKFEMPYSQSGFAAVYYCRDGKYAIVLYKKDNLIIRKKFDKDTINQDDLVEMISESGIDFLSFSAIYDTAEEIEKIVLHPEELIGEEVTDDSTISETGSEVTSDDSTVVPPESQDLQDEIGMVDLSALDASEFTDAKDFDKFVAKVKEFVKEGQPLPVKEVEIQKSGGVICIIMRKMDSWFIRFKQKNGTLSDITEINIDQDEIARAINNAIPQISFSYLYDASENVFQVIEQLALKPMDEVILNVAVGHFMKVIEQHEIDNDLKAAARVTEVLFDRFKKEKNSKGILQFGQKLIHYLEAEKKASHALNRRNELVEELLDIDLDLAYNFVIESLEILDEQKKYLNAANLCGLILDQYLTDEENFNVLKNTVAIARKQVDLYEKARLPVVMSENAERYAHFAVQQISKIEDGKLTEEERDFYNEEIEYLIDKSLEGFEKRNAVFELLESIDNTLEIFAEANYKHLYSKYADRYIISCETQDQKKKALNIAIKSSEFLMDIENFSKACEFGNQAIKLFYELSQIEEAVDFSLSIVNGLVDLKESSAATDYLKFVENLIEKAYEKDPTHKIEKQLALGDLFGKLGMQDRSKAYIETALQAIKDQKKREKIVLKYVSELLSKNAALTAQEMVNLELSRLLTNKKIGDVINFCKNFIEELKKHQQTEMIFEYMKYIGNLLIQTDTSDYDILLSFIKDLTKLKDVDKAAFMVDQLIALQFKKKDYTRAIDNMGKFLEYLFENTERYDLIQTFIHKTTEAYHGMGDPEGAVERLIGFQKELISHSLELAQRITDIILKELERKEDFKGSIDVVSRLIDKQMEQKSYQDAYIYCVQSARYYERLGDIGTVINYLEKMRDKFVEYEQLEDANRMTDLILRFGRSHKQHKLAINAVKNYSKVALDTGDTETATKFTLEIASLLEEEGEVKKALEYLQMVFNTANQQDKESSLQIFQRIIEIRGRKDEFLKLRKDYLEPLLLNNPDIQLIEAIKQVLKPSFDEFSNFSEKIYDKITETEEISDEIADSIVNFVKSVYSEGMEGEGDRLANKYARKMIDIDKISISSSLMAIVLECTKAPLSEVIPASFVFIKDLLANSLLEAAREYTDRVIKMITIEKKLGNEGRLLAAKLTEKFASYVAVENPDLASEYAYQAADYYRQINDFKSVIHVYTSLAEKFKTPKHALRILNRGIYICKKYKAGKYEAKLLAKLTRYLIMGHNEKAVKSFQQTLELYEELQDLDELLDTVVDLIESAIESNNLHIAYSYLDYSTRLGSMINKTEIVGGILLFLLKDSEKSKDNEKIILINGYFKDLGLKTKKYKKEYESLVKRQKSHLEVLLEPVSEPFSEPIPEPIPEPFSEPIPEPIPEPVSEPIPVLTSELKSEFASEIEPKPEIEVKLVETSEIVSTTDTISDLKPSTESTEEIREEEVVNVIKTFEQDHELSSEIPSLEGIVSVDDIDSTIDPEPISESDLAPEPDFAPEISSYEPEIKPKDTVISKREVLEIPPRDDTGVDQKTSLSDDEIDTLFSLKEPSVDEPITRKEEIPVESIKPTLEEDIAKVGVSREGKASLSDDEVTSLFTADTKAHIGETEVEEEIKGDGEWEVDSFGRLWKKGTVSTSVDEKIQFKEDVSKRAIEETPDLSPLELILGKESEVKKESDLDVLQRELQESQLSIQEKGKIDSVQPETTGGIFDKESDDPFASIVSSLTEDEESDPFMVPRVSYKEIPQEESPSDSQVKPPELVELFSSALSELRGISGEKGESPEKKKKKG